MKPRLTLYLYLSILFVALLAFNNTAFATQKSPGLKPVNRDDVFKGLQLDIEKEKQKATELSKKEREEKENLKALRQNIIPLAKKIQTADTNLRELEAAIEINEEKRENLRLILKDNKKLFSESISAALRLKRVPAETLFLQAATPLKTAQTAMILERTVPNIKIRMDYLTQASKELANVTSNLQSQKIEKKNVLEALLSEEKEMKLLIASRQSLIKKTNKNYKAAKKKADRLKRDAKTLKELVAKLKEENKPPPLQPSQKPDYQPAIISSSSSNVNWPVAGKVKVSFGSKDVYGAKTQGVKLETRPSALVTTPMDGIVRFAGPFKNYGNIAIIEHSGGWHSMIGGLANLSVIVEQNVKSGEPVGRMSSQNTPQGLLLYYELRYKGNPVNPGKKIKGLG